MNRCNMLVPRHEPRHVRGSSWTASRPMPHIMLPTGRNSDRTASASPSLRVQTRHPRFPWLQTGKVVDADPRRFNEVAPAADSLSRPICMGGR